jgi:ATP/maltotriose-dependent transcriptional regulator MalT
VHRAAAEWFAAHGDPAEAVRRAQQAQDWKLALRRLTDNFLGFILRWPCWWPPMS